MASAPDFETATEEEVLRYTNAFIAASNALGDAIIILQRLEAIATLGPDTDGQLATIVLERRRLEDEAARNERSFIAFHTAGMAMHPPDQAEVDAIVGLASELALLTRQKANAAAVIALATDVANRFSEIRGD